jgi:6-phosphogluconolactonase
MAVLPEVHVLNDDAPRWASEAAAFMLSLQQRAVKDNGRFLVALSGGRTPEQLYQRLASIASTARHEWRNTHFFFGDERCVPPDHPDSNYHLAEEALFKPLHISADQIHRMKGEHPDPEVAAKDYEDVLRASTNPPPSAWPNLDLVLLGLGSDGHTASLFPGTDALKETRRWATVGHAPANPRLRLTLTLGVINHATVVLFLANGESKAAAVKAVLEPQQDGDRNLPAALVRPDRGRLIWLLDRPAAAKLTGTYMDERPRLT